jgi:hypothetical protein
LDQSAIVGAQDRDSRKRKHGVACRRRVQQTRLLAVGYLITLDAKAQRQLATCPRGVSQRIINTIAVAGGVASDFLTSSFGSARAHGEKLSYPQESISWF